MLPLFNYSSDLDLSIDHLIRLTIVGVFLMACCAYFLYFRDREAKRLFDLSKQWGKKIEDDVKELKKTRFWLVIGYSGFLVLCLLGTARVCFELLRRL